MAAVPEAARVRRELGVVARAAEVAWPQAVGSFNKNCTGLAHIAANVTSLTRIFSQSVGASLAKVAWPRAVALVEIKVILTPSCIFH